MGYFNRDSNNRSGRDNRGGGRGFGGGRDRGMRDRSNLRGDSGPREMFKTVCSNCGKECEVPFRPTTGKPVYCSDCFEKMGGRDSNERRPERPERNRSDFSDRPQTPRVDNNGQFSDLNAKLDKIIELLTPKAVEIPVITKEIKSGSETSSESKMIKTPKVKRAKVVKEDK